MKNRRRNKVPSRSEVRLPEATAERSWFWRLRCGLMVALGCGTCACVVWALSQRDASPDLYGVRVVNAYPHDPPAYTQGLAFSDDFLYEGTGKYGESTLRKVELETGQVVRAQPLNRRLFGEGITVWNDRIVQLTWKSGTGIVYKRDSFRELGRFRYAGQGWGLTHDGRHLILSDGSATLRFLDPRTYRVVRRVMVHSEGQRVGHLNELEYVDGEILANIWYKDHIARISPQSGAVTGWIDLRGLLPERRNRDDVLNGIAYDPQHERLFVTGKHWPKLFEIQVVEPDTSE
jgi:glutaminyl-peptide cyclotransferase